MPNRLDPDRKVPSSFSQDHKGRQFELCPPRILPEAGAEGQHQPWERTEARMGVRLLGRTMLGQTVVAAIIYGFVRTVSRTT